MAPLAVVLAVMCLLLAQGAAHQAEAVEERDNVNGH